MEDWWRWLAVVGTSYLLGSIPTGLWIGKVFFGIDVREYGSHRTGATNVLRTMGKKAAAAATAGDMLKAVAAVAIARWLLPFAPWAHVLSAVMVAVGHNWPVFVGFRGGRGVVVSFAATGMLYWPALVILFVFGVTVVGTTRYVSLGSVLGAALTPILFLAGHYLSPGDVPWPYVMYAVLGATLVIASHKDNIERLRAGTESKLGQRVQRAA